MSIVDSTIIMVQRASYSSERYYLLSELEQVAKFPAELDESIASSWTKGGLVILYILCKLDEGLLCSEDFVEIDKVY